MNNSNKNNTVKYLVESLSMNMQDIIFQTFDLETYIFSQSTVGLYHNRRVHFSIFAVGCLLLTLSISYLYKHNVAALTYFKEHLQKAIYLHRLYLNILMFNVYVLITNSVFSFFFFNSVLWAYF